VQGLKKNNIVYKILFLSTLGLEMGICVGVGVYGGIWLDKKFHTSPYLTIFGIIIGFGAAIKSFIRMIKKLQKEFSDEY